MRSRRAREEHAAVVYEIFQRQVASSSATESMHTFFTLIRCFLKEAWSTGTTQPHLVFAPTPRLQRHLHPSLRTTVHLCSAAAFKLGKWREHRSAADGALRQQRPRCYGTRPCCAPRRTAAQRGTGKPVLPDSDMHRPPVARSSTCTAERSSAGRAEHCSATARYARAHF